MTDPNKTHIAIVLDRSGSMQTIEAATIGGFNEFINVQRQAPGEATVTLVRFDDRYEIDYNFMDLREVPPLRTLQTRGMTALYDAIGRTINEVGQQLARMPEHERPGRVVFVIITDGQENKSTRFNRQQIAEMTRRQTEQYNWQFVYLGANQDAIETATSLGMNGNLAATFKGTSRSMQAAFSATAQNISSYREERTCLNPDSLGYSAAQRSDLMGNG